MNPVSHKKHQVTEGSPQMLNGARSYLDSFIEDAHKIAEQVRRAASHNDDQAAFKHRHNKTQLSH